MRNWHPGRHHGGGDVRHLPPLPLTSDWLDRYSESLAPSAEVQLGQLLDFLAGNDRDDVTVIDPGDDEGNGAYLCSNSPTYHPDDLTAALIGEVRRLRGHLAEMERRLNAGFKVNRDDVRRALRTTAESTR